MNQYKVSLHYNMKSPISRVLRDRTLIWDKEERPIPINRLVRKKITRRLAKAFIDLKTKDKRFDTLGELMTIHLGRQWIKEICKSKVKEYEII